jgi:Protein of unknown function (DUF2934)
MSRSTTTSATAPQTGKGTQASSTTQVCQDRVAARAYQKWMQKGCPQGSDKQDWAEAEAEIKAEMGKPGAAASTTQTRK